VKRSQAQAGTCFAVTGAICDVALQVSNRATPSRMDRVVAVLDLIDVSEIEEEDEANTDLALVFAGVTMLKHQRCAPVLCEQLKWARHVSLLNCEGQFTQMYHMCYTSYCKLQLSGLRTIVLFHPDCNYAFKYIGREMMTRARRTKTLAAEQYGSRQNHRAIDLAVNKTLTNDILRQLKRTGVICSNDAKSCYGLIGHTQASLIMHRHGVPKAAVDCLFTTLQDAEHKVRTAYGDSCLSYGGNNWVVPIHGIGQGNGAGPAIWAVVSTPLLNLLRSKGCGFKYISPTSKTKIGFVGYSFVDDTDLLQVAPSNKSSDDVCKGLQKSVDTWEGGLKVMGGAIVPEKTFWYLIDFAWNGSQWRYKLVEECQGDIYANDINDQRKPLRRVEVHDAEVTLGVALAPNGETSKQESYMLEKAMQWANAMR
jgi:hypothetical protein